jgi:DNA primase
MSHSTGTPPPFTPEEIQADDILRFFAYGHLPPHLQAHSKPWADFARHLIDTLPRSPERTVALRKLLEGKDAAVRASLPR